MILTCPACGTCYEVADDAIGADGRDVRCSKCSNQWHQDPVSAGDDAVGAGMMMEASPPSPFAEASLPPAFPELSTAGFAQPPSGSSLADAPHKPLWPWAVAAVILLAVLGAGALWPNRVMSLWPATTRLYHALGIEASQTNGLQLQGLRFSREPEGGAVVIKGEIANTSARRRDVPQLQASFYDAHHLMLKRWTFALAQETLDPGETTAFETSQTGSTEANEVVVTFAQGQP